MKIAYVTAGAAGRYCGNCLRDSALVLALRKLGEDAFLLPAYTPIRTDVADVSVDRVFLSGFRVYLEQKFPSFRRPRPILDRILGARWLISLLTRIGPGTDASRLGGLTVSMLRGEEGYQRKEVEELASWLAREVRPDVIHLTNILLIGLARRLKEATGAPVVCGLQAEDSFLDLLPPAEKDTALSLIRERSRDVDAMVSVSRYYADFAAGYFGIERGRIGVVQPGIVLDGHDPIACREPPELTVGYLGRIAPEKGVHLLCDAFTSIAQTSPLGGARLRVAGYLARDQIAYAS
ncbi:MAG: glycosyltransferase family 4 protein, partial [Planctomycetes bacterium]|nr:glycosyltransferase family 4 protein [Planctomycetota bacterium]